MNRPRRAAPGAAQPSLWRCLTLAARTTAMIAAVAVSSAPAASAAPSFTVSGPYGPGGLVALGLARVASAPVDQVISVNDQYLTTLAGSGNGSLVVVRQVDLAGALVGGRNPRGLVIGDFNEDGRDDAALFCRNGTVEVHLGELGGALDGTIGETAWSQIDPGRTFPDLDSNILARSAHPIAGGDFNGDGHADLVVPRLTATQVDVLLGAGDGTFSAPISYPDGGGTTSIAVADLDWDGDADLVVTHWHGNDLRMLLGAGDGSFTPPSVIDPDLKGHDLVITDINRDWEPDVAVATRDLPIHGARVFVSDGSFFSPAFSSTLDAAYDDVIHSTGEPQAIAAADVNADYQPDLVIGSAREGDVVVFTGRPWWRGSGFDVAGAYRIGSPRSLALADIDADGRRDILVAGSGGVTVLRNVSEGHLTTTPNVLECNTQGMGSTYCWVQVENTGDARMQLSGVSVTGPHAGDFEVIYWPAFEPLIPGSRCWIFLLFTPSAAGEREARLEIESDADNPLHVVPLTGK